MGETKTYTEEQYNELQTKLAQTDERAKKFESQFVDVNKKLEKFASINLDEVAAMRDSLAQFEREKASKNPEKLKEWQQTKEAELRKQFQDEIDKREAAIKQLSTRARELEVVDKAIDAIRGKFTDDAISIHKDMYIRRFVDRDESGNFVIKDDRGEVRYSPGQANVRMTLDEFAEEIAKRHPSTARSTVTPGAKQNGTVVSGNGNSNGASVAAYLDPNQRAKMPAAERFKLAQQVLKGQKLNLTQSN